MSENRRNFLKKLGIATAAIALNPLEAKNLLLTAKPNKIANKPIVISTWNFGLKANEAAWKVLNTGGRALDAVEMGVRVTEADPNERSVGYGGRPDRDGHVTLDACIMDENANCGSVACLEHIMHPISVARLVMEKTPHVMLVADGALEFALSQGFKKMNLLTPKSEKEWKEWLKTSKYKPIANIENHDTIGMLAIDAKGNLSGACTTSGMAFKMHGRVGDSPIIGAGLYVDNEVGGATSTGDGEETIRVVGSHMVVEQMRLGKSAQEACEEAVDRVIELAKRRKKDTTNMQVGFLALNKNGEVGAFCIQKGFTYAVYDQTGNNLHDSKFALS